MIRTTTLPQFAVIAAAITGLFTTGAHAAGGTKDVGFGSQGTVLATKTALTSDIAVAALALGGGKNLVLGVSGNGSTLIQLTAAGALDTTFSGDGKVELPNFPGASALARLSSGKLLITGTTGLMRLNADGSLDTDWGVAGIMTLPVDDMGCGVVGEALQVLPDDRFFAAGWGCTPSIVAFNSDGTLNTGFGISGVASTGGASSFETSGQYSTDLGNNLQKVSMAIASTGELVLATSNSVALGAPDSMDFGVIRFSSTGVLDTSFNGTGYATYDLNAHDDYAYAVAVRSDGKIIVAGSTALDSEFVEGVVIRLNGDGSLDSTFSQDGKQKADFNVNELGSAVYALYLDGSKMVLAGSSTDPEIGYRNTGVIRLNDDGGFDTSFSGDGRLVISTGTENDVARTLLKDSSGSYFLAGSTQQLGLDNDFSLLRLTANGVLDTTFSADGKVRFGFRGIGTSAWLGLLRQSDGKLIAVGDYNNGRHLVEALVRYNANGSLDNSFGTGGWVTGSSSAYEDTGRYWRTAAQQADGHIVACGELSDASRIIIARYDANGLRDTAYASEIDLSFWSARGEVSGICRRAVALADGRILLAVQGWGGEAFVIRLNVDGTLDSSFNNGGVFNFAYDPTRHKYASANGIAVQADGKLLVGGRYRETGVTTSYDLLSFRLLPDGILDTSYNGTGSVFTDIAGGADSGRDIALQGDGKFVIAGYSQNLSTFNMEFSAARFLANGMPDTSFSNDGKFSAMMSGSQGNGYHFAVAGNGKTTIVGGVGDDNSSDSTLGWVRLNNAGELDKTFTGTGKKELNYPVTYDYLIAVIQQPDGKIVSAGSCGGRACLIRLMGDASSVSSSESTSADNTPVKTFSGVSVKAFKPVNPRARCAAEHRTLAQMPAGLRADALAESRCLKTRH